MHQVAERDLNGSAYESSTAVKISVVLLAANSLDAQLLAASLNQQQQIDVLAATSDLEFCVARCGRLRPQILILDPKISTRIVAQSIELTSLRQVQHLLVLDDRLHEGRLCSLLKSPRVSYVTRQAGLEPLVECIQQIALTGDRAFEPDIQKRLRYDSNGLHLENTPNRYSVTSLTTRELQVMTLLAGGYSVRRCAEELGLAVSTIDNHKSRLMKKLDIHKIVELTHAAIREGLIVV